MRETFLKLGLQVSDWSLLAKAGRSPRRTWRVLLESGETVKLRRLLSVERAQEVQAHLQGSGLRAYPEPLVRHQDYFVEPWIEGESLESPDEEQVVRAAALLRSLHESARKEAMSAAWWEQHVQELLEVYSEETDEATREALESAPETMVVGLIHKDFCGSNLIQDAFGEIWSVDNEWLCRDCIEFDLARSLFLWRLSPELEELFLQAYGAPRPSAFWSLAARLRSVRNRSKEGSLVDRS